MKLIEALEWRYAVKKFDPLKKISENDLQQILKAAHLAPSSSGLQPYEIFVITNQELKQELVPFSMNQQQIADCSHLLVFAAWDTYTEARIDAIYNRTTDERGLERGRFNTYTDSLKAMYLNRDDKDNFDHTARQVYISFGMALAAAAELKVDATPMEGFDVDAYDRILDLKSKGLKSVVVVPLGYRDSSGDWLVNMKKVRQPEEQFFHEIK